jgi:hypothetical protein
VRVLKVHGGFVQSAESSVGQIEVTPLCYLLCLSIVIHSESCI